VEAADDRAVSLVGVAQRERAMGAAVLEPAQLVAEPLHEDRARRDCRAEPIPVLGDVMRKTEKRPHAREPRLLVSEPRGIDQGVRPIGERARCRDLWLHRSASVRQHNFEGYQQPARERQVVLAGVYRTSESSFPRAGFRALLAVLLKERERIPDRRG